MGREKRTRNGQKTLRKGAEGQRKVTSFPKFSPKGTPPNFHLFLFNHEKFIFCSNHEKTADKPKLEDTLQNTQQVFFKNVEIMKDKERLKDCYRQEESKET